MNRASARIEELKRQRLVERIKTMRGWGHGVTKIAKELNLPVSKVKEIVDELEGK